MLRLLSRSGSWPTDLDRISYPQRRAKTIRVSPAGQCDPFFTDSEVRASAVFLRRIFAPAAVQVKLLGGPSSGRILERASPVQLHL